MASDQVERKLAAILAADVVGYSRLMGEDEAGTARAVREHREAAAPIVASHGGRVVKTMGDGVLLEFPSVVAAVECAIDIQIQMSDRNAGVPKAKQIRYRMGVNLGDVLIDGEDILGDGVNIAARLESIADPGGICISSAAYEQVRDKIDVEFLDRGEQSLKNIARPVRAYSIEAVDRPSKSNVVSRRTEGPPRLSIVVLPFANMTRDPDQDYFVDGVTESLTTDLSRMSGMLVIGRNTAFTYKAKAVDLKQIGRELNVRYVLEGSVQRGGNRMRVNVQLINAETGTHLWAERFDKPIADLFDMQDEIVSRLANALNAQLIAAEARRAEQTPDPDSTDLYFQGMSWFNKGMASESLTKARGFFEVAVERDPTNVLALVGLATVDAIFAIVFLAENRAQRLASAEAAAARALSVAPDHAMAHAWMGRVLIYTNRAAEGIAECERALILNRNLAEAHAFIGVAKIMCGCPEQTEGHINEALRLSPRDARSFGWLQVVGAAKIHLGEDEEAVAWLRRSIEVKRNYPLSQFYLAAALALRGRPDEARLAVRAGGALDSKFTITRFRAGVASDNATYLAQRGRVYEGMRVAGVPEE
jgi:TolB-like protein/class 3 adenylate cyclase